MAMTIGDDQAMVTGRRGITRTEIAERYDRTLPAVKVWVQHPEWPQPIGKRGRSLEYDPDEVEAIVRRVFLPPELPEGTPGELVTVGEAAERADLPYDTLSSYLSRGTDWPEPATEEDGTKLYRWEEMRARLMRRRRQRKGDSGDKAEPST